MRYIYRSTDISLYRYIVVIYRYIDSSQNVISIYRGIEVPIYRSIDLSKSRYIEVSKHRSFDTSQYRYFDLSKNRAFDLSFFSDIRYVEVLTYRIEHQGIGRSIYRSIDLSIYSISKHAGTSVGSTIYLLLVRTYYEYIFIKTKKLKQIVDCHVSCEMIRSTHSSKLIFVKLRETLRSRACYIRGVERLMFYFLHVQPPPAGIVE